MRLLYYRNLKKSHFFSETDFNLSSNYTFNAEIIDQSDEYSTVKVDCTEKIGNLFSKEEFISDAKIIVGQNGSGKSTIIDEIIDFMGDYSPMFSEQILIGEDFILIGDKIKFDKVSFAKLKTIFPNLTLYCSNTDSVNRHILSNDKRLLSRNKSYIQQQKDSANYLFFYSNSLDSNRIKSFDGKLFSTGELREDAVTLHDISDINEVIISNKWGIDSPALSDILQQNNLISYDDYEVRKLFDLINEDKIELSILPDQILEKLQFSIHFGTLANQFTEYILDSGLVTYIENPFFFALTLSLDDVKTEFTRQLLLIIIFKSVDIKIDSTGVDVALKQILVEFEQSLKLLESIPANEPISFIKMDEIIRTYLDSPLTLFNRDLYLTANKVYDYCDNTESIKRRTLSNGFKNDGIILDLKNHKEEIKTINRLNADLYSIENFRTPFIQFTTKNLSTGERHMLYLITRLSYSISHINPIANQPTKKICLIMDEPNNSYHPNWQKQFFNTLYDYFKNINVSSKIQIQLIISTHSPFLLSDFSDAHVLRLGRNDSTGKTIVVNGIKETFGANIHDLLADDFFMSDSFIGEFARQKVNNVLTWINAKLEICKARSQEVSQDIQADLDLFESDDDVFSIISILGDDMIKNKLLSLFYEAVPNHESKNEIIADLKRKIKLYGGEI
jgi:predicted ATPase